MVPNPKALTEQQLLEMSDDCYMNKAQLDFFRQRLEDLKSEIMLNIESVKQRISSSDKWADVADTAAQEEDHRQCLRLADREARLLPKINSALRRIERGSYGYCEETGEPIGVRRLLLRPTAELCAEAKARREQLEKHYK